MTLGMFLLPIFCLSQGKSIEIGKEYILAVIPAEARNRSITMCGRYFARVESPSLKGSAILAYLVSTPVRFIAEVSTIKIIRDESKDIPTLKVVYETVVGPGYKDQIPRVEIRISRVTQALEASCLSLSTPLATPKK